MASVEGGGGSPCVSFRRYESFTGTLLGEIREAEEGEGRGFWQRTWDLLLGESTEVVHLALVRGAGAVPEEEPLQGFVAFELVGEAEHVFFVGEFKEVEQLGAGFHDGERRVLAVVDDDGDAAWGYWCKQVGQGGKEEGGSAGVPLGSSLRNQSFFCSLVMMLLLGRQYPVVIFSHEGFV